MSTMTRKRQHTLEDFCDMDASFEELLLGCLGDDESDDMDFSPWQSPTDGHNSPSMYADCVANYPSVAVDDVSFSSDPETDFRVLDPVKLEPLSLYGESVNIPHLDTSQDSGYGSYNTASNYQNWNEGTCNPALSIACDILDVNPAELIGLANTENYFFDRLLEGEYKSDDSGAFSDSDISFEDMDLFKRTKDLDSPTTCPSDAFYNNHPANYTRKSDVIKGFTLWRFDDSHMPIKKRRRNSQQCPYEVTHNHTPHDTPQPNIVHHSTSSLLPTHRLFTSPNVDTKYRPITDPPRKKPGRKPGQCSKGYHLWEFMRDLLRNPDTCPRDVMWVDQQSGIFRICNSDRVAQLWGARKNNKKCMTYEKLSRALRFSRTAGYFGDLPKNAGYPRKLCFKFGPKTPLGQNSLCQEIKIENCLL